MHKTGLNDLRSRFLNFFESKGHMVLPSYSLVPNNDPSILLINAGMTPLKPYFTGEQMPPSPKVATCQKCIRTPDIENVGKTARHGTFFEMLGNFSFGDYFKESAITWAWEFFTRELEIPVGKLMVSVYEEDDEAYDIWNKTIGLSPDRIVRMGKQDNFWEHGTGPCGPCSEIYFDRGKDKGCGDPLCRPGCDCDRFIEVWNLVFTQFNKTEQGEYLKLEKKNIDTGMGLERLAVVLQGADSLFEVDTIRNILDYICERADKAYGSNNNDDISIRVITDHIRSTVFMISDGVIPSNEGRGYVLRRLIRRAARHSRLLGISGLFLNEACTIVINESSGAYPELVEKEDYIRKIVKMEEERFETTVDQGLLILNNLMDKAGKEKQKTILGEDVFKLHDTYGFPLDLTREIAAERGLLVDEKGFAIKMGEQKKMARDALREKDGSAWGKSDYSFLSSFGNTAFTGYENNMASGKIIMIINEGQPSEIAEEGEFTELVCDITPFYGESGGQLGDKGIINTQNGSMIVEDCKKISNGIIIHTGHITRGFIKNGDTALMEIDMERRKDISINHTITHLLHKSLKNNLGVHVAQAGSFVGEERFRFDFSHFGPLSEEEIEKVEDEVNDVILLDLPVVTREMSLEEAKKAGATALFDEKYGKTVRMVSIGDYSHELCGGTHLSATSQAGILKITSQSGIAAGIRRIEGITGRKAFEYIREREKLLLSIAVSLKATPEDCPKKAFALSSRIKECEKEIDTLKNKIAVSDVDGIISGAEEISGFKIIIARLDNMDMQTLRSIADTIKSKAGKSVIVLASALEEKVSLLVMASKEAVAIGIHSGNIIREAAILAGGGGGGRPDMAQAGGKEPSGIDAALKKAEQLIRNQLIGGK